MTAAALMGCADDVVPGEQPSGEGGAGTGEMVFFSSGTTENEISRATSTYYMPNAYRFVCRMYYKAQTGSDLFDVSGATDQTSWLKVSGTVGNSLYWNKGYSAVGTNKGEGGVDAYGNDFSAHAFYWQNRKPHAFLAWTDLNHATSLVGGEGGDQLNSQGADIYTEKKKVDGEDVDIEHPCNAFDLTRKPSKDADGKVVKDANGDVVYAINSMAEQPDIVQALTIKAPTGATQEANRVNLYFKHQFSQVQVNVKNAADNSVALSTGDIQKVELLGVTEKGYVFTDLDENGKVRAATYKPVNFADYDETHLQENRFGTAFDMFLMPEGETAYGFLRSFNAITFGQLQAIRITWEESDTHIQHVATYRIPDATLVNLKSGMRYVWNIEIRRGTLAIIRTEIIDWELPTDAAHNGSADGTITN